MAVIYFVLVMPYRAYMKRRGMQVFGEATPTRTCPVCLSDDIPLAAAKCQHCLADLLPSQKDLAAAGDSRKP